jgi:dTDP-4-amino-4,6-dideoxygalactose transaminase
MSIATDSNSLHRIDPARKRRLGYLAAFGGQPAFAEPLHVGRPNIVEPDVMLSRFSDILARAWLTNNGDYVQQFETLVADYVGVRHCVATCNGTLALQLVVRALNMTGEVIVPSLTFVATAHALSWQHVRPVFADIDSETWTLDAEDVERHITPRTTGIMGVHLWGQACDVQSLSEVAARHRLHLVFDACHALGCTYQSRRIGGFGEAEVLSFHATKFVNSAEGGAIVTNNDQLADRLRKMRNFGFSADGHVDFVGTNAKMSEFAAAVGLTSMENVDYLIEVNTRNHRIYQDYIRDLPGLSIKTFNSNERCNCQYIVMEIDERRAGLSRDELVHVLRAENVLARRYFHPGCHRMSTYAESAESLPVTEDLSRKLIVLPTGQSIDETHIRTITEILGIALHEADRARRLLRHGSANGSRWLPQV